MKFGLYFDLRNPGPAQPWPELYAQVLSTIEQAEQWGADSVWFSEHHGFADGYLPQPLTFAAAVAARTSRIRIGTAILLAPLRAAVQIAEEATIVDILSNGRLDLGLGAGYRVPEFELFGVDGRKPIETMFRRGAEIRDLLASGRLTPPAVQDPLPIWYGANGRVGARRAGAHGVPLLSINPKQWEAYRDGLLEGGHDLSVARMGGVANVFLTDDPARDRLAVGEAYAYLWSTYDKYGIEGTDKPAAPPIDVEASLATGLNSALRGLLVATPAEAAAILHEYVKGSPVETVFSWSNLPGLPPELNRRHVELWSSELPREFAALG